MSLLLNSIARVKMALGDGKVNQIHGCYMVKDYFIYASNGHLMARAPIDCEGEFLIDASTFENTLRKFASLEAKIKVGKDNVTISQGRFRNKIKTLSTEAFPQLNSLVTIVDPEPIPPHFFLLLKMLKPFTNDKDNARPATTAYWFKDGNIYATTGFVACVGNCPGLHPEIDLLLHHKPVSFLLKNYEGITTFSQTKNHIMFNYSDGGFFRSNLLAAPPFEALKKLFETAPAAKNPVTDDWLEAYRTVAALSGSTITIADNEIRGDQDLSNVTAEITTDIERGKTVSFEKDFLDDVLSIASYFDPNYAPGHVPFKVAITEDISIRGFISPKTVSQAANG